MAITQGKARKRPQVKLLEGARLIRSAVPSRFSRVDGCEDGCSHGHGQPSLEGQTCRRHVIVLPGTGRQEFPLPSAAELIEVCLEYINEVARLQRQEARRSQARKGKGRGRETGGESNRGGAGITDIIRRGLSAFPRRSPGTLVSGLSGIHSRVVGGDDPDIVSGILPRVRGVIPTRRTRSVKNGATLWAAAGGFASVMYDGRFEAHIAEVFDPHMGAVDWARRHMDAKYQPTVESLTLHFEKLIELCREAVPTVMHALAAQYRDATEDQLIDAAMTVIMRQLAEIIYILSIWTDSFAQQRDGKYSELNYVVFGLEQAFRLFTTGDPMGGCDADCQEKVKNQTMHVGDVFMARYSGNGPATIPGARGPVGAHAVEVPHDERDIIVLMGPVYKHEFRHDYYADVVGLPEQMAQAVLDAIDKAAAEGKFKFKSDTISLGGQKVPTLSLLKQIAVQTLSETDADVAGGMLLTGPAFLYSLIAVFSAFNSRGHDIFKVKSLLRPNSRYGVTEQGELVIAPHMPDYPRAYFAAAALDHQGFHEEANECRELADQAVGSRPDFITWSNSDPRSRFRFKIQVPFDDLVQLAPVVADAIINSKLPCLGGLSTGQLVNWNAHRQEKVNRLAELLMEGRWQIPADMKDIYSTYVEAAAITAYWGLVKSGARPIEAIALVETAARKMMDVLIERFKSAASTSPAPAVGEPAKPASPAPSAKTETARGAEPSAGQECTGEAPAAPGNPSETGGK